MEFTRRSSRPIYYRLPTRLPVNALMKGPIHITSCFHTGRLLYHVRPTQLGSELLTAQTGTHGSAQTRITEPSPTCRVTVPQVTRGDSTLANRRRIILSAHSVTSSCPVQTNDHLSSVPRYDRKPCLHMPVLGYHPKQQGTKHPLDHVPRRSALQLQYPKLAESSPEPPR